jgi:hypothetical protein
MDEGQKYDRKSLLTFAANPARWDWQKIAKHCIGSRYFISQKDAK